VFDLVITGATVVDGTGRAPFTADVAVADGRIAEIGSCTSAAHRTIAVNGAHVLPGFVDIHTHYDGQVTWDADLSPSSRLGVTTCVHDLPAGGRRLVQRADGFLATLVAGVPIAEHGALTGSRPGTQVRMGGRA